MVATLQPLRIGGREFAWGQRTYVMGILNVTPDSFSGDGVLDVEQAVARGRRMEAEGADLIDVGGESTRPATWGGPGLPVDEEKRRVLPVVTELARMISIPISIDTYKAEVAEAALRAGASVINDVFGLRRDPDLAAVVARTGAPVIVMHNQRGTDYRDLVSDILQALEGSIALAVAAGIGRERVICDPGIGFGKTREQNLELVRRLGEFRRLGRPILVGPSRKSFIGKVLGTSEDDRLHGTAAVVSLAIAAGADVVRVHDVKTMVRVARMADAVVRPSPVARAWLALGSNLGDRAEALAAARAALAGEGIRVVRTSTVAETDPVGVTEQPRFLNQVLEVVTAYDPMALLERVKLIERQLGRTPGPRWGPRRIDIDILLYGERVVDTPELRIPHPELRRRPFLLQLLAELDPHVLDLVT